MSRAEGSLTRFGKEKGYRCRLFLSPAVIAWVFQLSGVAACSRQAQALLRSPPRASPVGYTPPEGVTDLSKAPGLRSKLMVGGEGQARSYSVTLGMGDEIMSGMTAFARRERLQALISPPSARLSAACSAGLTKRLRPIAISP
jgi:hypothetical protein